MAFEWNEENTAKLIEDYLAREPTPETSHEIVNDLAAELGEPATPNGVRMKLVKAKVYITKTPASSSTSKSGGAKKVSKADAQQALKDAIEAKGHEVDADIVDKMTGKAAQYFTEILKG